MKSMLKWLIGFAAIAGLACSAWLFFTRPKTGYIMIREVYDNFELKKDLQKKFEGTDMARKKVLDSLELALNLLGRSIEQEKGKDQGKINVFNLKREEYFQRKRMIEEDNAQLSSQYDKEILGQLNQYVGDFGKERGYTYIFGNDGNGSLMHADEACNLTKEVSAYINNKYKK
jgi:outer membrane protein